MARKDVQSYISSSAPRIWLKLDEANSTLVDSGSLNTGATWSATGSFIHKWSAASVDSTGSAGGFSRVYFGGARHRTTTAAFLDEVELTGKTINIWARGNNPTTSANWVIWDIYESSTKYFRLYAEGTGGTAGRIVFTSPNDNITLYSTTLIDVNPDNLRMLTVRMHSGGVQLYVDGVIEASTTSTVTSINATQFDIASTSNSGNWALDEFSVWNASVFNQAQIEGLYDYWEDTPVNDGYTTTFASASAQFSADPTISIASNVTHSQTSATASAQFSADPTLFLQYSISASAPALTASAQFSADPNILTAGNPAIQTFINNKNPEIWYHLDESAASAVLNQGSITGNPSFTTSGTIIFPESGVSNTGVEISSGYSYIETSASTQWSAVTDNNFTINMFFKFVTIGASNDDFNIFQISSTSGNNLITLAATRASTNDWRLRIISTGFTSSNGSTNIADGNWHLLSVRLDGTTLVTYVDGVAQNTLTGTPSLNTTLNYLRLGKGSNNTHVYNLDEFTIFPSTFTATDIYDLYGIYAGYITIRPGSADASAEFPNAITSIPASYTTTSATASAQFSADPTISLSTSIAAPYATASALMTTVPGIPLNFISGVLSASAEFPNASTNQVTNNTEAAETMEATALIKGAMFIRPLIATANMPEAMGPSLQPIDTYYNEVINSNPVIYHKLETSSLYAQPNYGSFGQTNPAFVYENLNNITTQQSPGIDELSIAFNGSTQGAYKHVYDFSAATYLPSVFPNTPAPDTFTGWSLEYWFKPKASSFYEANTEYTLIDLGCQHMDFSNQSGNVSSFNFILRTDENKNLNFQLTPQSGVTSTPGGLPITNGGQNLSSFPNKVPMSYGQWNQIVFTQKEYQVSTNTGLKSHIRTRVYLNGVKISEVSTYGTYSVNTKYYRHIGRSIVPGGSGKSLIDGTTKVLHGYLDEISLYPRQLTDNEISRHYLAGTGYNCILEDALTASAQLIPSLNAGVNFVADSMEVQIAEFPTVTFSNTPLTLVFAQTASARAFIVPQTSPTTDRLYDLMLAWGSDVAETDFGQTLARTQENFFLLPSGAGLDDDASSGLDLYGYDKTKFGVMEYYRMNVAGSVSIAASGPSNSSFNYQVYSNIGCVDPSTNNSSTIVLNSDNNLQRKLVYLNGQQILRMGVQNQLGVIRPIHSTYFGSTQFTFGTTKENAALLNGGYFVEGGTEDPYQSYFEYTRGFVNSFRNPDAVKLYDRGFTSTQLKLINGKIAFEIENDSGRKTYIGKNILSDGNLHHVIYNRTTKGMSGASLNNKTKKSRLEIWVDGNLEIVTQEITENNFLRIFLGLGFETDYSIQNDKIGWTTSINPDTIFVGHIGDFIQRNGIPLSYKQIQNAYHAFNGYVKKIDSESATATAIIVEPQVNISSKNVLRLYWDIKTDKQYGLSINEADVKVDTYSVFNKLLTSPRIAFNYDAASSNEYKVKHNVKTVVDYFIDIDGPGIINEQHFFNADAYDYPKSPSGRDSVKYTRGNMYANNKKLVNGDKILVIKQHLEYTNGVYTYNGPDEPLTRVEDIEEPQDFRNSVIYVTDGNYAGTSWIIINDVIKRQYLFGTVFENEDNGIQIKQIANISEEINDSNPIIDDVWKSDDGEQRFIDLENDIDIDKYDMIIFMNYPETDEQIEEIFKDYDKQFVRKQYNNFISQLKTLVKNGKSLYVSSPKLAIDAGLIKNITKVAKTYKFGDSYSYQNDPFKLGIDSNNYFNTHEYNKHRIVNQVDGLTTLSGLYVTDVISVNNNSFKSDYHIKYASASAGISNGTEFYISSIPLLNEQTKYIQNDFNKNQNINKDLYVVKPSDLIFGKAVTKLSLYNGLSVNLLSDYITSFVLEVGELLDNNIISGKIFACFIEDGLTMGRLEYNQAKGQIVGQNENATLSQWQYSTTRLNKNIKNVSNLTEHGQTRPSNGGGGGFIQAPTNNSNGIIRFKYDESKDQNISNIYYSSDSEKYQTEVYPILSISYRGYKWLGG